MTSLLIKLPNWMGDILFSYDVLFSLSRQFDRLALCTSDPHQELFQIFPIPDAEVIAYASENWPNLDRETIRKIWDFQADETLILPNSFGSALIMKYAGASHLCGYDTEHRGLLMHRSIPAPRFRLHQTEYYLRLLKLFNAQPTKYPLKNAISRKNIALLHPGASKIQRAWPLDRFIEVGEKLRKKGMEVVFVSGEKISANGFEVLVRPSLSEFAELLRTCSLFLGNDSGPLHLAQQCGAPVVGIYGPGNPITTGPRSISPHRIVYHAFPCSPCRQKYFKECEPATNQKPFCIDTISVEEVWRACAELLNL